MPDWFYNLLTSQFIWGILLGILLTTYGAFLTVKINKNNQEKTVKNFCKDSFVNILKFITSMDDHRDRAQAIHHDFLDLIELEINVYGRNREHLVYISDENLRQHIRDLYNTIAVNIVRIKQSLDESYRVNTLANDSASNSSEYQAYKQAASTHLENAQTTCDKLVGLKIELKDIIDRI